MIDGLSGVDLTTILLNVVPSSEVEEPEVWVPRPAPTPTQLSVAEVARLTGRLVDRLTHLSEAVRDGVMLTDRTLDKSAAAFSSLRSGWLRAADRTPLNPDIGPNRRFDWTDTPLEAIKDLKNKLGGSVNDVVLAITAGAVRRFLIEERGYDVSGAEFRVMNPVSTRRPPSEAPSAIRSPCGSSTFRFRSPTHGSGSRRSKRQRATSRRRTRRWERRLSSKSVREHRSPCSRWQIALWGRRSGPST